MRGSRTRQARERIPDPNARTTFEASRLRWDEVDAAGHREWLAFYRRCLAVRQRELVPRLAHAPGGTAKYRVHGDALHVQWRLGSGDIWHLAANFGAMPAALDAIAGDAVFASNDADRLTGTLPARSVRVLLETRHAVAPTRVAARA